MANLTSVTLTSGLGTGGTGTISTLDNLIGTAGTSSAQVLSVQGIASGTALPVNATLQATATTAIGKVDPNTIGNWGLQTSTQNSSTPTNGHLSLGQFNTTPTTITSGNVSPLQLDNAGNLLVNIKAGAGSGGTAIADEASFTEGTTSFTPIGGVYKSSQTALTSGQAGAVALSAAREVNSLGKVWDGTNTAAVKAASTAPVATDTALVVAISPNSVNANGLAAASSSAPVVVAPTTTEVAVTPTITASAYTAGNVIGGILTFASILDSVRDAGILESITVKFKGTTVTGNITLNLFKASPSNGTYTDKTAPTWNASDGANLLGSYVLTTPVSNLGTMTVYNLDGIGKAIQGASTSLYAVLTVAGTPTPASTSDMTVSLTVLPG